MDAAQDRFEHAVAAVMIILKDIAEYSEASIAVIGGLAARKYIGVSRTTQSPYLPAAAKKLKNILAGSVPYISAIDLLIFKMHSCGLRAQVLKSVKDANDAERLLGAMSTPLSLTSEQQGLAEPRLADVVSFGSKPEEWWRQKLGLPDQEAAANDILGVE